jgi:hypothetical protein
VTTTRTLDRVASGRYPVQVSVATDAEIAAELERQLGSYDTDVLTALAATATFHGSPDTDDIVLRAARRIAEPPRMTPPVSTSGRVPL